MFCSHRSPQRYVLSIVLALTIGISACDANKWISVALADLPVLVQMALNIAGLAATFGSGQGANPGDVQAIQNLSAEASKDLTLIQNLYNQYQATPTADTLQAIEKAIADVNTNLPAILQAAHIQNKDLSDRVEAAVALILDTVGAVAALIPQPANPVVAAMKARSPHKGSVPKPDDLKRQWNQKVAPQFKVSNPVLHFLHVS